jgi:hypothetical protein
MTSSKKEDFSRDFLGLLGKEGISEKARPYYLRYLERWGVVFRLRPAEMSERDFLEGDLEGLSHTDGVEPFVVYQTTEAIRLAHEVLLGEEWPQLMDWEGYRAESCREQVRCAGGACCGGMNGGIAWPVCCGCRAAGCSPSLGLSVSLFA